MSAIADKVDVQGILTNWNPYRTDHHTNETILRLSLAALRGSTFHVVPLKKGHDSEGDAETDPDRDERQANKAIVPTIVLAKDDGETEEECILKD